VYGIEELEVGCKHHGEAVRAQPTRTEVVQFPLIEELLEEKEERTEVGHLAEKID
jgi:hypothetical protein